MAVAAAVAFKVGMAWLKFGLGKSVWLTEHCQLCDPFQNQLIKLIDSFQCVMQWQLWFNATFSKLFIVGFASGIAALKHVWIVCQACSVSASKQRCQQQSINIKFHNESSQMKVFNMILIALSWSDLNSEELATKLTNYTWPVNCWIENSSNQFGAVGGLWITLWQRICLRWPALKVWNRLNGLLIWSMFRLVLIQIKSSDLKFIGVYLFLAMFIQCESEFLWVFAQEGTAGVLIAFSCFKIEVLVSFIDFSCDVNQVSNLSAVVCRCGFGQLFPTSFPVAFV